MNQDQVKEKLLTLRPEVEEFFLIFSGKQSKKVNGLYHPESREIIIHNRNFTDENALMYTAIHEFAHHVHYTQAEGGPVSNRAHTVEFRAIFHQLLSEAEAKSVYENKVDQIPELRNLAERIREKFMKVNGELMKDFGQILMEAEKLCRSHNARFEDFIERALRLPKQTATTLMKIKALDIPAVLGYENMKTIAGIRNNQMRSQATEAFLEGETPDQIKHDLANRPASANRPQDPRKKLISEKKRIEKTVASLKDRLDTILRELEELGAEAYVEAE